MLINFDLDSCLWFNSFALNLHQSLVSAKVNAAQTMPYIDVKIEAILPRVTILELLKKPFSFYVKIVGYSGK